MFTITDMYQLPTNIITKVNLSKKPQSSLIFYFAPHQSIRLS